MSLKLHPSENLIAQTDISTLAQQFVLHLFNQKNDPRLVFRTYRQTVEIAKAVSSLAQANGFTEKEWEETELAAWFVNVGYLFDYQSPEAKSIELAGKFFAAHNLPAEKKTAITAALRSLFSDQVPKTGEGQLLSDAVRAVQFGNQYFENAPLLRLEQELMLNHHFNQDEWLQFQLQQLLNVRFYTSEAKMMYEPVVAKNIVVLKEQLEKRKSKNSGEKAETDKKFQHLKNRLSPGTQTYFRTNYRTHINLSAIADNKANIMISMNAILISVVISIVSYRNMTETNPSVLIPVVIFLVMGLASLIFAVLAARPKVTSAINDATPLEEAKRNLVFFGNFIKLKPERYEELMDEMFQDSDLLYGNMVRDLYNLGKVLDKKYRYLTVSYNIFMVGFVATVLTFLTALLG